MFDIHSPTRILPLVLQPLLRLLLALLDSDLLKKHITAVKDGTRIPRFGTFFIAEIG